MSSNPKATDSFTQCTHFQFQTGTHVVWYTMTSRQVGTHPFLNQLHVVVPVEHIGYGIVARPQVLTQTQLTETQRKTKASNKITNDY